MNIISKDIEHMIRKISGDLGLSFYKALKGKENINEFDIAESLKVTINQLRNIIYKFDEYSLLSTTRKKDRKKGWYIYFLTFREDEAKKVVIKIKKDLINEMEKKLRIEESNQFYVCPRKCGRAVIENAMENQFLCTECGELQILEENSKNINQIKNEVNRIKKGVKN